MAEKRNGSFMNRTKSAAKEGFDVVHDTVDVIGDNVSKAAKKVTGKGSDAMNMGGKNR